MLIQYYNYLYRLGTEITESDESDHTVIVRGSTRYLPREILMRTRETSSPQD